jgi:aromatic ring-opening dioxygenase catalytic subunit (LigB family)
MMAKQPTFFITHGGGPCFWIEFPEPFAKGFDELRRHLEGLLDRLPERPRAILVVSGHWEAPVPTISTAKAPPMLFDYYGFPEHTYHLRYPASGAPDLAMRVQSLLNEAGIATATDGQRGFDHGVFVPLLIVDPAAKIPVLMLSLQQDLDPARHLAIGAALAPLRDEGVLIVGSGSSYHNLRKFFADDYGASAAFDDWLNQTVTASDVSARNRGLVEWRQAPNALDCHPRAEHLVPLMVAAGAGGEDAGRRIFNGRLGGKAVSCYAFGAFSPS